MQTAVSMSYNTRLPGLVMQTEMREIVSGLVEDAAGIAPGLIVAKGTNDNGIKVPTVATDITTVNNSRGAVVYESTREGGISGDFLQKEDAPVLNWGYIQVKAQAGTYTKGGTVYVYYATNPGQIAATNVTNTSAHPLAEIAESIVLATASTVWVRFKR